ncbi:MAG: rRNA maturation RNase YbeY [Deferribacteraceae bacterium]|jgi:probable rRNA maturation factor|nr:rRNA maturation RNase YbeY [Deferribacteraceae bacterium]
MKILLDNEDLKGNYESFNEAYFQSIIDTIAEYVEFEGDSELSIVLTDDESIASMNQQYRNKPEATDVLSFPMEEEFMLGDIVISLDTAARQAQEAEIDIELETAFLFIHGFLHLLGYDHETSDLNATEMFDLQEEILRDWVKNDK